MNNNALAALTQRAAPQVVSAIKAASAKTGVNFAYLVEQAATESSFKTDITSKTSSATGLYQFIESTWMNMVEKYGDKYGLGDMAEKIKSGEHKQDSALKNEILELRKDAKTASLLAAEFAAENQRYMESQGIDDIGSVELYLAHFMGAGGATAFLKANEENPLQTAADLFPKAARANRNVFYDRETGQPRTLAGVYDFFAQKFQASANEPVSYASSSRANKESAAIQNAGLLPQPLGLPRNNAASDFMTNMENPALRLLEMATNESANTLPLSRMLPYSSLVNDPVQLIMMAQLDLPGMHKSQ